MKHKRRPEEGGALYKFAIFLCYLVFFLLYPKKVFGRENIPKEGPLVICSNHINWFDPPLIGAAVGMRRQVCFMAKAELFDIPIFNCLITKLGAFPVKREKADLRAIMMALSRLDQDKAVGLFPEGTRSKTGQLQKPYGGPALIILKSGAPVLPVAIKGPYRLFRPIKINIGKPIYFDLKYDQEGDRKIRRENIKKVSTLVMEQIKCLLDDDMQV